MPLEPKGEQQQKHQFLSATEGAPNMIRVWPSCRIYIYIYIYITCLLHVDWQNLLKCILRLPQKPPKGVASPFSELAFPPLKPPKPRGRIGLGGDVGRRAVDHLHLACVSRHALSFGSETKRKTKNCVCVREPFGATKNGWTQKGTMVAAPPKNNPKGQKVRVALGSHRYWTTTNTLVVWMWFGGPLHPQSARTTCEPIKETPLFVNESTFLCTTEM